MRLELISAAIPSSNGRHLLAIDPGPETSGFVLLRDGTIGGGQIENDMILNNLTAMDVKPVVLCEWVECFGMAVGREVFDTCRWVGRFEERARDQRAEFHLITRREVKLHLCNSARAKDGNVRQVLLDRYGGKQKALGNKAAPGPLYGVKGHAWSALAIAVCWMERGR